jgi:succinate dehydrogenase/fumarate reductase flavoprotein subunit
MEPRAYSNLTPKQGWSWETPPAAIPESRVKENVEADVAIIGGGLSGLAAGARCASLGMSVIIADKSNSPASCDGRVGVLDSPLMLMNGISINKKQFARDWIKTSSSRLNEDLLWLYMNRSGEALEWLLGLAEGEIEARLIADSYRGPSFNDYYGTHTFALKKGSTKYQNSEGGALICEVLETAFLKNGGKLFKGTRAVELNKDETGCVKSFIAVGADGQYKRFTGKKAVVLATGDIGRDPEMLAAFCPIALKADINQTGELNTGDGHKLAYWAGAAFDDRAWATAMNNLVYSPYSFYFLHVNQRGRRFMNEDTWTQAKAIRCLMQPGGDYAYTIMDSNWLEDLGKRFDITGGQGITPVSLTGYGDKWRADCGLAKEIEDIIAAGNGAKADTLEELAAKIGVPAEALVKTVSRYNEVVTKGLDYDFGKRSELLTPVVKAPFYALKWGPALEGVYGGALTNTKTNVLGPDYKPIPGLYAVGKIAGGIYGVDYPQLMTGIDNGRALTWALALADAVKDTN